MPDSIKKPLEHILIRGPGITLTPEIEEEYRKEGRLLIGDGINPLFPWDIKRLIAENGSIDKDTIITINGHGFTRNDDHNIQLLYDPGSDNTNSTSIMLKIIADLAPPIDESKSDIKIPLQIHLFSCYGGASAKDIDILPNGSTLVCHSPKDEMMLLDAGYRSELYSVRKSLGKILDDSFSTAINDLQCVTIATKLQTGESRTISLRAPRENIASPEELVRFYYEQWERELKEKFSDVNPDYLPYRFNLSDIPPRDKVEANIRANIDLFHNETALIMSYNANDENKARELISFIQKTGKNPRNLRGKDSFLEILCGSPFLTNPEIIDYTITESKTILNDQNGRGQTVLHLAAFSGKDYVIAKLLENGADPNLKDNNGATPLHIAAHLGRIDLIEKLLDKGADPNLKDNNGVTPLHIAAHFGRTDLIEKLLDKGANPNLEDNFRQTPLQIASKSGIYDDFVKIIKKRSELEAFSKSEAIRRAYEKPPETHETTRFPANPTVDHSKKTTEPGRFI